MFDPYPSGLPLYRTVARQMLHALAEGEWAPGEAIPAERQLCARFGVSIGTLRRAVDELVTENILIRHQGRGTFVATHNRDQHLFRFFNIVRQDGVKNYPTLKLIRFGRARAGKTACDRLGLSRGATVFQFTNVLSPNNEPTLVDEITVPEALFAGLTGGQIRERANTLYDLYQTSFLLNVIRIEERLRGGLASAAHARLLGVTCGAPLLQIYRIAFSYNNQPVELRVSHVNTANYEYFRGDSQ